MQLYSSI